MKKNWSRCWVSSKQPRKQRKFRANAPLHTRHRMLSAHLSKELRKQYLRRSMPVRTGDEVVVKRGEFRTKSGKVSKVDIKSLRIFVEGLKVKKVSGQEVNVAIDPSNVMITKLYTDDKERMKALQKLPKQQVASKPPMSAKPIAAPVKPVSAGKTQSVAVVKPQIAGGSKTSPVKTGSEKR